jgi:ribosomal protein S18 acetylase RimI-like enzyme
VTQSIPRADIQITTLGAADANELLHIYSEALDPAERKSDDIIRLSLTRADYLTLGARGESGQLLGFASLYKSATYPFSMLEYLATDHAARGQGIGAKLVEAALVASPNTPLLIEVDAILPHDGPDAMTRRRQNFYRRLGCLKFENIPYRMPQVGADLPPPMNLFLHPNGSTPSITRTDLHAWLIDVYHHVYNRPAADAEIAAFMPIEEAEQWLR